MTSKPHRALPARSTGAGSGKQQRQRDATRSALSERAYADLVHSKNRKQEMRLRDELVGVHLSRNGSQSASSSTKLSCQKDDSLEPANPVPCMASLDRRRQHAVRDNTTASPPTALNIQFTSRYCRSCRSRWQRSHLPDGNQRFVWLPHLRTSPRCEAHCRRRLLGEARSEEKATQRHTRAEQPGYTSVVEWHLSLLLQTLLFLRVNICEISRRKKAPLHFDGSDFQHT